MSKKKEKESKKTEKGPETTVKRTVRKAKKKVGRPTRYSKDLDEQIIELGRQGKSVSEMVVGIGLKSRSTFYEYLGKHDSFKEAFEAAKLESQSFWEAKLTDLALSGSGNMASIKVIEFVLKSRFRDDYQPDPAGVQVNINATPQLSEQDLDSKILKLQKKLGLVIEHDGGGDSV